MNETVIKYTRVGKNQMKMAAMTTKILYHIDQWLQSGQTGKIEISVELNATQGGLGDVFIERRERGKV